MIRTPIRHGHEWFQAKPALEVSPTLQLAMIALMGVLCVATLVHALRIRTANPEAPWLCVGAFLCSFYEPLGDLHSKVAYHEVGQIGLWTAYGFHIPLWGTLTYLVFFGFTTIELVRWIERNSRIGFREWAALVGLSWLGSAMFEIPMIALDLVDYYARPGPLAVLGFPVWIGFVNGATIICVACVVALAKRAVLVRAHPASLALVMPVTLIGVHSSASLPVGAIQNGPWGRDAVNLAASVSILVAIGLVSLLALIVSEMASERE